MLTTATCPPLLLSAFVCLNEDAAPYLPIDTGGLVPAAMCVLHVEDAARLEHARVTRGLGHLDLHSAVQAHHVLLVRRRVPGSLRPPALRSPSARTDDVLRQSL
jgi:hypothetical protein